MKIHNNGDADEFIVDFSKKIFYEAIEIIEKLVKKLSEF